MRYMRFPVEENWYLVPPDVLVGIVNENTNWLTTSLPNLGESAMRIPAAVLRPSRLRAQITLYALHAGR